MTILYYDNTFEGFLTAVFESYEYKFSTVSIVSKNDYQEALFSEVHEVVTDPTKADRVLKKLEKTLEKEGLRILLYAFLSEEKRIENYMFRVIKYALEKPMQNIFTDFANPDVLHLTQITKSVGREKHRMEAFVRFELLDDGVYFATIEPDFNVLMLIKNHFEARYQDQKWIIYDTKRAYGIFYDLNQVETIFLENFSLQNVLNNLATPEINYQKLWKGYFKSTNIHERVNPKLHTQHVPKRYWKYLTEKKMF